MPRSHVVGNGLGAEREDREVELRIRKGAAGRQRTVKRPRMEDATKHRCRAHRGYGERIVPSHVARVRSV